MLYENRGQTTFIFEAISALVDIFASLNYVETKEYQQSRKNANMSENSQIEVIQWAQ